MNFNAPLVLVGACYMNFLYIGPYALLVVVLTLLQMYIGYACERKRFPTQRIVSDNVKYRHLSLTEIMNNIKGVKLYGWEHKLIEKMQVLYEDINKLSFLASRLTSPTSMDTSKR